MVHHFLRMDVLNRGRSMETCYWWRIGAGRLHSKDKRRNNGKGEDTSNIDILSSGDFKES